MYYVANVKKSDRSRPAAPEFNESPNNVAVPNTWVDIAYTAH